MKTMNCAVCGRGPIWHIASLKNNGGMFVQMRDGGYLVGCTTECVIELCKDPTGFTDKPRLTREEMA